MKVTSVSPAANVAIRNSPYPAVYGLHFDRAVLYYSDGKKKKYKHGAEGMKEAWQDFQQGRKGILV